RPRPADDWATRRPRPPSRRPPRSLRSRRAPPTGPTAALSAAHALPGATASAAYIFASRLLQLKTAHGLLGAHQLPLNRPRRVARVPRHLRVAEAEALQPHQALLASGQSLELSESLVGDRELLRVGRSQPERPVPPWLERGLE